VKRIAVPATLDELAVITETMPERMRLLIVLAAFVGLREGELLELRRSDIDGVTGRINVTRKVDKDVVPATKDACPNCGRVISAPKTASGVRTVHVPPPFLPMLQKHLLEHTAPGPAGLLFAGDRTDHLSVRYLMDRYARPGRPPVVRTSRFLFEDALDRCSAIREHVAECAPDEAVVDEAVLVGYDVPHALHLLPLDCWVLRNETVSQARDRFPDPVQKCFGDQLGWPVAVEVLVAQ